MKRDVLLVGARGQVSRALQTEIRGRWQVEPVLASPRPEAGQLLIDLARPETIAPALKEFRRVSPGSAAVYLVGAWTHVDACEADPVKCYQMNSESVAVMAAECEKLALRLIFFSSEYVYGNAEYSGGRVGPFRESDPVDAPCVYGESKARGERAILERADKLDHAIVRTTIIYSWLKNDMNFPMQLHRFLQGKLEGQAGLPEYFRIPEDQITTPTFAPDLATASLELTERGLQGIWHLVGKDRMSRAKFTDDLVELFGFSRAACEPFLRVVKTKDLGQVARRPLTAGLEVEKALKQGLTIGDQQSAFQRFATDFSRS